MAFNHFNKKKVLDDRGLESRKGRRDFKKFKDFFKKVKNLQTNYPKKKKKNRGKRIRSKTQFQQVAATIPKLLQKLWIHLLRIISTNEL